MTTLTEEQIEAIRARAKAATPGPWRAEWSERDAMDRIVFNDTGNWLADVVPDDGDGKNKRSDALFIAHAREDIPALLSHIEEMEKRFATQDKRAEVVEAMAREMLGRVNAPEQEIYRVAGDLADIALKAAAEKADAMMKEMERLALASEEDSPSRDRLMARALCALYIKEDILALTSEGKSHE